MFSVTPKYIGYPKAKRLFEGETFAFFETPQEFELRAVEVAVPLTITINIRRNKEKKPFELSVGGVVDGRLEIDFYNPSEGSPSGTMAPIFTAKIDTYILGISFLVWVLPNSPTYYLRYQFDQIEQSDVKGATP